MTDPFVQELKNVAKATRELLAKCDLTRTHRPKNMTAILSEKCRKCGYIYHPMDLVCDRCSEPIKVGDNSGGFETSGFVDWRDI